MSADTTRRAAILEPVLVFAMIMQYIWGLRSRHPFEWLLILGLMLLSHWLRHEPARTLGFQAVHWSECWEEYTPALALLALLMLAAGILLQTTRAIPFDRALVAWMAYLPWGLFQQYILNGYFLNRFTAVLSPRSAPMAAAALFSSAHLPNLFLMAVTLVTGYICARIYQKHNNLWFLGLAHATVGFFLFLVVPDSISHHLTVGPGFLKTGVGG
ncbi:MAG TPA: CPBP family intramembrane glutamic endopeptidase [Bryobacteraceae bacterium]|nr:CPBP family intramembrane glutamic endopeptidase [Bryobacteraceae bacterium]